MLSKNLPIAQPARLKGFGHPWHGLVTNGTLTAADGETRTYLQPAGNLMGGGFIEFNYTYGATNLLRAPDAPGAGELITKPGQQWADYAILAGESRQLYATELGASRWVYVAPDGSRWLVDCPLHGESVDFAAPLSTTITLSRFGVIGGEAQSYDLPASLADIGQPGPIDDVSYDFTITSGTLSVESITSSGGRTVLMLYLGLGNETPSNGYFHPIKRRAIGYLEIALSGTPGVDASVSLSVLRDRATTLGSIQDYFQDSSETFTGRKVQQILDEDFHTEPGPGYTDQVWTPVAATYPTYTGAPGETAYADVYSGNGERHQLNRIIALAFDASDLLKEWTTNTTVTYAVSAPEPTETIVGNPDPETRIRVFDDGSPNETISSYSRKFERTRQEDTKVNFSLAGGNAYNLVSSSTQFVTTDGAGTSTDAITVGGEGGGTYNATFSINVDFLDGGSNSIGSGIQMAGWTPGASGGDWASFFYPGIGESSNVYVVRYSNNLVGTLGIGPYGTPSGSEQTYQSNAVSPSASHTITTHIGSYQEYGSWNPATGEAIFAEPNPVCWV